MMEPGKPKLMQELVNQLNATFKKRKGFKGATYFADEVLGQFGALVLWDSEKNATFVRSAVFSKTKEVANGLRKGPLLFQLFKVVEQKPELTVNVEPPGNVAKKI